MLLKIFVEINISIIAEIINSINIINEKIVCLKISNFMFSFLLSFIIDLYSLKPLTASARIAGINNIFCINNVTIEKINPLVSPNTNIDVEIVYPRQNPLYSTIPNTIGIPITVVPKNQITTPKIKFCIIEFLNKPIISKF